MIKQPLISHLTVSVILGLFCFLSYLPVFALSTDKDQPIEVEADKAELDDLNNVSIYRGNVIVRQGSILMTGEILTVYNMKKDKLDHIIMEGNPATYKQLPDNSAVHDQATALRMEYYELKNLVVLIRDAWVKQDKSTLTGERIEYNTENSRVKAWSRPKGGKSETTSASEKKSRVKLILKKKKEADL